MSPLFPHLTTFLLLLPVGLRRLLISSSLLLQNPSQFRSLPWFFSHPLHQTLDFFPLLLSLPIASLSNLLSFSSNPSNFPLLQQSLTYFLFWVLLILILLRQFTPTHILTNPSLFLLAGLSFLVDFFFTGTGSTGVSQTVYDSLAKLTLLCGFSCLCLAINPNAFFADFFLSIGVMLKATWVLNAGLVFYTDVFGLRGCSKVSVWPGDLLADVKCELEEDRLRGIALMNLLFVVHVICGFSVGLGVLGCKMNARVGNGGGPLLTQIDSESLLVSEIGDLEMD